MLWDRGQGQNSQDDIGNHCNASPLLPSLGLSLPGCSHHWAFFSPSSNGCLWKRRRKQEWMSFHFKQGQMVASYPISTTFLQHLWNKKVSFYHSNSNSSPIKYIIDRFWCRPNCPLVLFCWVFYFFGYKRVWNSGFCNYFLFFILNRLVNWLAYKVQSLDIDQPLHVAESADLSLVLA